MTEHGQANGSCHQAHVGWDIQSAGVWLEGMKGFGECVPMILILSK